MEPRSDSNARPPRRASSARVRLGRYEILERLGAGGMAEVWKARALDEHGRERIVAIKRLAPELAHERSVAAMFVDEARLAAQLSHPGIVALEEVGRDDAGAPYMVLEYIDGYDLRWFLASAARARYWLPVELSLTVVRDLLRALSYAHEARGTDGEPLHVVHRDVSHSNVFVAKSGRVKLADFGIARARGRASQTRTGMVKGKIGYLSPEQVRAEAVDGRSDVFSAGVVLWELLTQRRMFVGETDFKTMLAVCRDPRRPPSSLRPGLPPQIDALVLKAVEIARDARYPTADAFEDAITDTARVLGLATGQQITASVLGYLEEAQTSAGVDLARAAPEPAPPRTIEVSTPFSAVTPTSLLGEPEGEEPSDIFARSTGDLVPTHAGDDLEIEEDVALDDGFSDGEPTESGLVPAIAARGPDGLRSGAQRRAALAAAPLLGLRLEIERAGHAERAHTFGELFEGLMRGTGAEDVCIDGQRCLTAGELTTLLGLDLARAATSTTGREWVPAVGLEATRALTDATSTAWSGHLLLARGTTRVALFSHGVLLGVSSRDPAEQLVVVLAAAAPDAQSAPLARLVREVAARRRPLAEIAPAALGLAPEAFGGLSTGLEVELTAELLRFDRQSIARRDLPPTGAPPARPALLRLVSASGLAWPDDQTEAALAPLAARRVAIAPDAAAIATALGFGKVTSPILDAIRPGLTVAEVRAAAPATATAARVLLLLVAAGALVVL